MEKFVCVFSETDRDRLAASGFKLIKEDKLQKIYVFYNDPLLETALKEVSHCLTNKISF